MIRKTLYFHVSFRISSVDNSVTAYGDLLVELKNQNIGDIRKEIVSVAESRCPDIVWDDPTILGLTELNKSVFEQLRIEENDNQ